MFSKACYGVFIFMQHKTIVRPRLDDCFMLHDFLVNAAIKLVDCSDGILWSLRRNLVVAAKNFVVRCDEIWR